MWCIVHACVCVHKSCVSTVCVPVCAGGIIWFTQSKLFWSVKLL